MTKYLCRFFVFVFPSLLSSGRLKRSGNADKEEKEDTEEDKLPDARNKEEEPNDGDAATVKEQQQQLDTQEYEGEEEERKEVIPDGEFVTYTRAVQNVPGDIFAQCM